MMGWHGGGMGPLAWLGMGVFWLILLGLIVWLVMQLLPSRDSDTTPTSGESPLEILDRRLASGALDLDTWQTHRAALLTAQGESR
jgi:putative membrane protein